MGTPQKVAEKPTEKAADGTNDQLLLLTTTFLLDLLPDVPLHPTRLGSLCLGSLGNI